MNIHKKARLTPIRREEMAVSVIESRVSKAQAALVYGGVSQDRDPLDSPVHSPRPRRHAGPFVKTGAQPEPDRSGAGGRCHHGSRRQRLCGKPIALRSSADGPHKRSPIPPRCARPSAPPTPHAPRNAASWFLRLDMF